MDLEIVGTPPEREGEALQIRLSPRTLADLSLLAAADDRLLEDYVSGVLETHLYGMEPVLALMRAEHRKT